MEKVRFGIIGFGNMGSSHAENLIAGKIENGELTAICDIKPKKLEFAREKYPNIAVFDNHADLLKSGLVDAIIVATPRSFRLLRFFLTYGLFWCIIYGVHKNTWKMEGIK